MKSESSRQDEEELNEIMNEEIEEFDDYEPLSTPFECPRCDFFTTDAVLAAEHSDTHNHLAAKDISRWEPSVSPVQVSVIVPNPNFGSVIFPNPNFRIN